MGLPGAASFALPALLRCASTAPLCDSSSRLPEPSIPPDSSAAAQSLVCAGSGRGIPTDEMTLAADLYAGLQASPSVQQLQQL